MKLGQSEIVALTAREKDVKSSQSGEGVIAVRQDEHNPFGGPRFFGVLPASAGGG